MTEQIICHFPKLLGACGRRRTTPYELTGFSLSNYKDSMKSPAATLSGFLGLGVSVATLLSRCTDGWGTGSGWIWPVAS